MPGVGKEAPVAVAGNGGGGEVGVAVVGVVGVVGVVVVGVVGVGVVGVDLVSQKWRMPVHRATCFLGWRGGGGDGRGVRGRLKGGWR